MLYPIISTAHNNKHQSEILTHYQEAVEQADNAEIQRAKELAIAYNEAIQPGAQLADPHRSHGSHRADRTAPGA
ncbi:MAG: hypothetical protein J6A74_00960 [Oscillospiraceae bacterium]|nr:hypothetical protein [Oscillospiraceae bacterium]